MKLPPIHNSRAPQQWEIISQHVGFAGKTVLDLGCGYGDILFRCRVAGAIEVWGCEQNEIICQYIWQQEKQLRVAQTDIAKWILQNTLPLWDIIICFSVLPYLDNAVDTLNWMKAHSEIALIECQYDGDGPGSVPWLSRRVGPDLNEYQKPPKDDDQMREILAGIGWQSIEPIGKTLIEDRQKWRTIWLCQ